jgi:hypothetical protein
MVRIGGESMQVLLFLATWMINPAAQPAITATTVPTADEQIAAAVLAAPDDRRAGATVLGYNGKGELVTLRKGANEFVCLADDPQAEGFSAACYHQDLEPYMARGRELRSKGMKNQREINDTRWKEIQAGSLKMPKEPRTLYVLTGKAYDAAAGSVAGEYLRWVIYVPFATPESTGLATRPIQNGPWLMDPGTPGAHIMITPPRPKP